MNEQPLRVLLVDDEASLREPLATYLRREHGYYVDTAASGEETLARIDDVQGQYHVALIDDLLMPTPDSDEPRPLGIKLMTEIRACYPHIEFIIFTGWGMESALEALRAGAYRYIRKPFDKEELAVMIEHAAEYQRLKSVAREKQILEQLMQTSTALLRGRDLHEVLDTILRGVQTIGFDRVRLYLLSQDGQTMVGQAQVGMETEFIGLELPVAEDVYVQALLADPRPRVFARKDSKPLPSEQQLAKEQVTQWACVPLLLHGEVIGKLSVDNKFSQRPIQEAELGPVALFASQAAAAIENAHLIAREQEATRQAEQRARNLEAIQEVSTAISSLHELDEILDATCRAAVEVFGVDHSGLVLFEADNVRGQVVAEYPNLGTRGIEIPVRGISAEERLTISKEPLIITDVGNEPSLGPVQGILNSFDIRSILIAPVVFKDRVLGSFSLDATGRSCTFTKDELELCKIFAAQVAVAVENAKLYESLEKQAETLADQAVGLTALYEIGKEMTSALDLDRVLDSIAEHIVRVVGARRSLFIQVDTKRGRLIKAVGHGYPPEHLQALTFEEVQAGVSGWVLTTGEPILVTDAQSDPRNTSIALERAKQFDTSPLIVAPLLVKGEVIGTLTAVNTADDPPFTQEDLNLVVMLANQAAIAIENARLFEETRQGLACLRSVSEAGSVLISTLDPDQILQIIVEQARQAVQAWRASIVLIDDEGWPGELAATGYEEAPEVSKIIRPTGITMQVVETGVPRIIEDVSACQAEVNPDMIKDGVGAACCFPLRLRGKNAGVMWIQYGESRPFSETEIEALRIYTKNAAIAFDNARRVRELEHMRRAAEALAKAPGLPAVLEQIVRSAREVLQADSAAIWSYDAVREKFILEGSIADGIPAEVWEQFRQEEPQRGQTGYTVMERTWVAVEDVGGTQQYPFLGESTRKLLGQIGARSFQGIALMVGEEKLGVLYVNYNRPRSFSEEEQKTARTFANHAALALKKVKLLDQVNKARNAARLVAEVTVLENLQNTLNSIVKGTRDVLGCDVVTLYTYDQDREKLGFPPAMAGVKHPAKVLELGKVAERSVIHDILDLDDLYVAEDTTTDSLMRGPFVEREEVLSSVGIPLAARNRKVGVMFVNYRHQHRFTADELTNIRLFAHQAAVAIRKAQLYEQVQKRAMALQALYEAGQAVISTLSLSQILNRIAEQACRLVDNPGTQAHILLVEEEKLKFTNAHPPKVLPGLREQIGHEIDPKKGQNGRVGITGRVVRTGESQRVGDIRKDKDYIEYVPETCSELAVPIRIGKEVIGVINVEHPDYNAFDAEDQHALESLAAQAAIAIQNANLFEQTQRRARLLDAAAQVARGATAILEIDMLLSETVRLISDCFEFYHVGVFLLDDDRKYAALQAAYPKEGRGMLKRGHRLRIGQEGIVGFVAQTGKYHLALDVEKDPHHLVSSELPLTRSEMVFPLIARGQVIGVLDVQSMEIVKLSDEDIATLQTMADQLANAIHNAQLYQQATRRLEESDALQQVAVSLTGASELKEVLNLVMQEGMKLTNTEGGSILFWDSQAKEFTQTLRTDDEGRLQPYRSQVRTKKGLTRMIIEERQPVAIPDTLQEPRINPGVTEQGYRASLGVPLLSQGESIGVVYLRSKEPRQFSKRQVTLLETLASQATVAIERARQYEELKRTKGLVGTRTAVAWMGMVSSAWRHVIEGHAMTIREEVDHLRVNSSQEYLDKIDARLKKIQRLARLILEKPITPPLSEEEGVESVPVNELLRERIRQLWENEPYKSVQQQLDLKLDDAMTVRASPEWLRQVFDIVVDNAVEAMADVAISVLTVSTRASGPNVEIIFTDTGPGIPGDISPKLFHEQIRKPKGAKGLGMGLLMAQTIVQTYGGEIRIAGSSLAGTGIVVSLPIEAQNMVNE
jgi:GAF domain-containing protein/CheY-like chemotaxis protein